MGHSRQQTPGLERLRRDKFGRTKENLIVSQDVLAELC